MKKQPLLEIFGYTLDNNSVEARRARENKLCPYNNIQPHCTKDKVASPLGVCSMMNQKNPVIICPVRFNQQWTVIEEAAKFLFPKKSHWTSFREIGLKDKHGKSAGNIDFVLARHDDAGQIVDYGALEVQAVYISGNLRDPFEAFLKSRKKFDEIDWNKSVHYPTPDFLSSSRKRLAPQLLYKGSILSAWKRKTVVAIDEPFFHTLPKMRSVSLEKADLVWHVYRLKHSKKDNQYSIELSEIHPTLFQESMRLITVPDIGPEDEFLHKLQLKMNEYKRRSIKNKKLISLP